MPKRILRLAALIGLCTLSLSAHVGSPDVYLDGKAGPYQLFVTIRPPKVIPGVAELEIRAESSGIHEIRAVPLPLSGPGLKFAPTPDKLSPSREDPQFFIGSLWMMSSGSWQVRITATGAQGTGVLGVPVPSVARTTLTMEKPLGALLGVLGIFLVGGVVAMAGAAVREARLQPGLEADLSGHRRGRLAMLVAFIFVAAAVWFGKTWWDSEANQYARRVYKPIQMAAKVDSEGVLSLKLTDPGWLTPPPALRMRAMFIRPIDDLVPDHNHLMHLYAIRQPGLDVVYHLHPEISRGGDFRLNLPSMPAGTYKLYADVVHATGFPDTMVATIDIPQIAGRPLTGDDAKGTATPISIVAPEETSEFTLPDGFRLRWVTGSSGLRAKQPALLKFELLDPQGKAPADMAFYMGMLGHAAFVKTDGAVFAHVHPSGSVPMAALEMAEHQISQKPGSAQAPDDMSGMIMAGMDTPGMHHVTNTTAQLPNIAAFPYGFPTPGAYRIFVQMKHGNTVETGVFDTQVQ